MKKYVYFNNALINSITHRYKFIKFTSEEIYSAREKVSLYPRTVHI